MAASTGYCVTVPVPAYAHTSEQALVLLLPTGVYTAAGAAIVALTMLIILVLPQGVERSIFPSRRLFAWPQGEMAVAVSSLLSFAFLTFLIWTGFNGPTNPLKNLLPLSVWTIFWMGLLTVQALFGDVWRWINPWAGPYRMLPRQLRDRRFARLPVWLGSWPGVALFLAFGCFMLADIAPEDPVRLAAIVSIYWCFTFACMIVFGGEQWLMRGEFLTVLLTRYARLSVFGRREDELRAGVPCWQLTDAKPAATADAVLVLLLLGTGSFDGLNETFWWLAKIGINPLEFPGRSAVVWPTVIGLLAANALLVVIFAFVVWLGLRLARAGVAFADAFGLLALSMLPIALAYHVAHYLTAFLVQAQYALLALNDPFATGGDLFGIGHFHVTTGFFNSRDTVEIIWLTQAGVVVLGHVLSIMVGHAQAARLFDTPAKAVRGQLPLAVFMILYTLFGLWLLATPRGA